ncbi:MAG: hypothetical protein KGH98_02605 [Candidatus Micrarchaeota archaeon]|nr:hypothetical protein [Candidatus Micrarchaeota archaeon]
MGSKVKGQGALLIQWGWLIVVCVIVVIVLLQLGIFSPGRVVGPLCTTQPGFICNNPVMNASGTLKIQFGQIVSDSIVITALSCTKNDTGFTNTTPENILVRSGELVNLDFQCTFEEEHVGNIFVGYLWIVYDVGTNTDLLMQFGKVITSVSTSGALVAFTQASAPVCTQTSQGNYRCVMLEKVSQSVQGGGGPTGLAAIFEQAIKGMFNSIL